MILLPAALMVGAAAFTRDLVRRHDRLDRQGRPLFMTPGESRFLGEFNRLVLTDPASLADPLVLASLDSSFGEEDHGAWAVYREGQVLYESRELAGRRPGGGEPDFSWAFRFPDGRLGQVMYSIAPWPPIPKAPDGEGRLGALALLLLLGCGAVLSWWLRRAIVLPLSSLGEAALRIGEGQLDDPSTPAPKAQSDEFAAVAEAFETMRVKLKASLGRQQAEEEARKELVAHVSHDLRTPISVLKGYAEGLRDGVATTEEMRSRYIEVILDRATELDRLIDLLFSYSTLGLEGAKARLAPTRLGTVLHDLGAELLASWPRARIAVDCPPDGGPEALADPEFIRRAVTNLVENSLRHGGREDLTVSLVARPGPPGPQIVVADDGQGLGEAELGRIFEPFYRGDAARQRGGAGLGLAIVRRCMEAQGGGARASARAGGGLEVTLSFIPVSPTTPGANHA